MKTKRVTFSMPIEVINLLRARVEKSTLNKFATKAIMKALEEENELRKAYAQANEDPDCLEVIEDWKVLDSEGWE